VGAALTRELLRRGDHIVVVEPRRTPGRLSDIALDLEWVVGDASDLDTIVRAVNRRSVDAIYFGPFWRSDPPHDHLDREVDVMATSAMRMFQLARAVSIGRVVFPSSTAVHGPQPESGEPVDETSAVAPFAHRLYGALKLLCEQMGAEVNDALGANVVVSCRIPSVYGPGADVASRQVNVPAVQAARGRSAELDHSERARVCVCHVDDLAWALAELMTPRQVSHGLYEVGGLDVSFGDIVHSVRRKVPEFPITFGTIERASLPHSIDWSRIRTEIGLRHRPLDEGISSIIDYELSQSPRT